MHIDNEIKLDFCDVLIKPKRSKAPSRHAVDLKRQYTFLNSKASWEGVPIVAANMMTGTFAMARALAEQNLMTALHKYYSYEELLDFFSTDPASQRTFYTLGIKDDDFAKLDKLIKAGIKFKQVVLDAASAYTQFFVDRCKRLREWLPETIIMAGNVCTPEMVQELLINGGADICKIGTGPGALCTTRIITGVGYPQLSAIIECAEVAHGLNGHICADGGCVKAGDVVKSFSGGADFSMLGGIFAGTDECEGEWEYSYQTPYSLSDEDLDAKPIQKVKKSLKFFGLSSKEAMDKFYGGKASYRAAEGKCVSLPYKGPVLDIVNEILGGLRSACTYVGTEKLKDLSKCTTFVRVNRTHNQSLGN